MTTVWVVNYQNNFDEYGCADRVFDNEDAAAAYAAAREAELSDEDRVLISYYVDEHEVYSGDAVR